MPKLKNSANSAISSARTAPRGVSIIVPMVTSIGFFTPLVASAIASSTQPRAASISGPLTVSGIITSTIGLPFLATRSAAASIRARTCMA